MEAEGTRGSDVLLEAYRSGGVTINEEVVANLASKLGNRDLYNILVKGQPVPDFVRATFVGGEASATGSMIGEILDVIGKTGTPGTIRVFPRGIPWPGEFLVDVVLNEQHT